MTVNKTRLASFFGVSLPTVGKWVERGCPATKKGNEVEFDTVDVLVWMYGEAPSLKIVNRREGAESVPDFLNPEQERARKDKEQADKTALENRVRRGELVEASEIEAVWTDHVASARARLLAMGPKLAPILAEETRPAVIEAEIAKAAAEVASALSDDAGD